MSLHPAGASSVSPPHTMKSTVAHHLPHHHLQGGSTGYAGKGDKADLDNHAQQLNPNNPKYNAPKK